MTGEEPLAAAGQDELGGRTLAGYRLEHVIGRGGMAVVYRAEGLRLGRTVAVKLLAPESEGTDPDHPEHAYLTDFGLTKKSLSLTGLTSVGQFVGTLDYAASEQISGKPVDGRCDVYSLGCVVHEMLTGSPPFRRDDDLALLWAHHNDRPPDALRQRADLSGEVGAVLRRAMAKRSESRYAGCLEFVAALRAASDVRPQRPRQTTSLPPAWAWPVFDPDGTR
ncbi:serine/threonine-protein kinase [Kitasatospora sp. NPDC051984]|uniref:serine/threonine-protein kinase n=1 Tax=Kitasatospora sp. NPDC051984 TaxID=3364059 RepID=UPI0037C70780